MPSLISYVIRGSQPLCALANVLSDSCTIYPIQQTMVATKQRDYKEIKSPKKIALSSRNSTKLSYIYIYIYIYVHTHSSIMYM